jgi:outer membrane murein-binding lipoprotein Lpp
MNIHVHHHHPYIDAVSEILLRLDAMKSVQDLINRKLDTIMSTLADAQAAQAITDQKIAAISTDVTTLLAKIAAFPPSGVLTADQQAAVDDIAAHASKINDALSAVDTTANPPAPTA